MLCATPNSREFLGQATSAPECAKLCKAQNGCKFFTYGNTHTRCYYEKTNDDCATTIVDPSYNIYTTASK